MRYTRILISLLFIALGASSAVSQSPTLRSIVITPNDPTLYVGNALQFVATGLYSDGSSQDLTNIVSWGSGNNAIATVSTSGLVTGVAMGSTQLIAVSNGVVSFDTIVVQNNSVIANVMFLGGGSSSLFVELGQAAVDQAQANGTSPACVWTQGRNPGILARDNRTTTPTDEQGNIWVVWTPGTGTCAAPAGAYNIWSYMSVGSAVGNRCYFEVDSSGIPGCVQVMTVNPSSLTAGNLLCYPSVTTCTNYGDTGALSTAVETALNGLHFFAAGTDIRPEDAKFAIQRAFTPCNQYMPRQYFNQDSYFLSGLGYQTGNANVGTQILGNAGYGGGRSNIVNFSITGYDPLSGWPVPAYSATAVAAQPIIVGVAPVSDANVAAMTDVPGFTLALFYSGVLGRTSDFLGTTSTDEAMTVLVPEPMSGTYDTFEYSIPNGTQYHASQDYGNCNPGSGTVLSNPMALSSGNGLMGSTSQRVRVIGTNNMINYLNLASTPTMGYFFWSARSARGLTNVKYLKVNGVDPILDSAHTYNGVLPGSISASGTGNDPGLGAVGFAGMNSGDYPIWSALRIIGPPGNGGVTAMVSALHGPNTIQSDYLPLIKLNVWHSHFYLNGGVVPASAVSNGTGIGTPLELCAGGLPEAGGDAGGANLLTSNNRNFCQDFGNTQGLLNKTQ